MTLEERISIIDKMIRENPDYTIRDYLELCGEVNNIRQAVVMAPKQDKWLGATLPQKRDYMSVKGNDRKYLQTYKIMKL